MKISIVICTHNRLCLLKRTLQFLKNAKSSEGSDVEILVIANGCSDQTCLWLEHQAKDLFKETPFHFRWIEEPKIGKAYALNRLLGEIGAQLIAFVDDDHRVDREFIQNLFIAANKYPNMDLICGRIYPDWDGTEPDWVHDRGPYRIYPLPVPRFDHGDVPREITGEKIYPGGGNLFIRRAVLEKVGPFRTNWGPVGHNLGGAEDIEWVMRALKLGMRLQYVPSVVQYHFVDPTRLKTAYLMRKSYERSASVVRLTREGNALPGIPPYLMRKIFMRSVEVVFNCYNDAKRRYYLVRLAGAVGELKGFRMAKHDGINLKPNHKTAGNIS